MIDLKRLVLAWEVLPLLIRVQLAYMAIVT